MADKPKKISKPPVSVEVFFDVRDGAYWYQLNGRFVPLKVSDLRMQFRSIGLRDDIYFDGQREIDWPLWRAMNERMIDFAGSLGGHRAGVFSDGSGRKFLVTDEARGVWADVPKKSDAPKFFCDFVQELLPDDAAGNSQVESFLYWLAIGLRAMRDKDFRPGQVAVFAGPVECGKSLLQYIITEILGGRAGSPMRYMLQETSFNKDFAGCEHWMIEEPKTSTDIRTRIEFGNALKECFNNRDFSIHGKGKEAITLPIFRRGSISVNDEPELLMVLPPLNGSVDDKMMLFRCAMVREAFAPFTVEGIVDRAALWAKVVEEIPLIRAWLLRAFKKVPKAIANGRFGVAAYHHPELRAELVSFTPEARLLALIDEAIFEAARENGDVAVAIEGRVNSLEQQFKKTKLEWRFSEILKAGWKLGSYLGKLAKNHPDRVSKRVSDGYAIWTINPPSRNGDKPHE